jgi:NADPH-dependent glutamate synthase beta subunit-like oxidoreductase
MIDKNSKKHYIAIIGGSISGSEAAYILAEKGYRVVVFEMNSLPYGKIEDGLPKWHINLRNKQEQNIDNKLDHPNIRYVPKVKVGKTISFDDLVNHWGFTVVIFANGAWQDRELPIDKINKFKNKGLIYQNDLLYWYNHKHEPDYNGNHYEIKDGTVVVGGGLSSLDVMKLGMIELVQNALFKKRGLDIDLFTFEKKGILKILNENQITLHDLNLDGMTLVYRRKAEDMPLKTPKDDSEESIKKSKIVSEKLLQKYAENFMFKFIPLSSPLDKIEKDGKLQGIVFHKNKMVNSELIPLKKDKFILNTPLLISSIGSLPEKIIGLPYHRSTLKMKDSNDYSVYGFSNVFAVGNAVTGRGNIQESKKHGNLITNKIIDEHLQHDDFFEEWLMNYNNNLKNKVQEQIDKIELEIKLKEIMPDHIIQNILDKTKSLQDKVGYISYSKWIKLKTPSRLEDMLNK